MAAFESMAAARPTIENAHAAMHSDPIADVVVKRSQST
jgi:hypothetical protein